MTTGVLLIGELSVAHRVSGCSRNEKTNREIPRILDMGCRLFHPRGKGRAEIQGLHPSPHINQTPVRRLRRRAEPYRRRGWLI